MVDKFGKRVPSPITNIIAHRLREHLDRNLGLKSQVLWFQCDADSDHIFSYMNKTLYLFTRFSKTCNTLGSIKFADEVLQNMSEWIRENYERKLEYVNMGVLFSVLLLFLSIYSLGMETSDLLFKLIIDFLLYLIVQL